MKNQNKNHKKIKKYNTNVNKYSTEKYIKKVGFNEYIEFN